MVVLPLRPRSSIDELDRARDPAPEFRKAHLITASHLARKAAVYLRQSSEKQVMQNEGSTAFQRDSDLAKIKREIENLFRPLESGRAPDVLVERLAEKDQIAQTLAAEITAIEKSPSTAAFDPHQLDRALAEQLGRFGEMLRGDVVKARQALQKLLVDRVRFTPITLPDGQRTYRLKAELTLGRILTAQVNNKVHVPDGI